jgi:hypothetical protein
MAETNDKRSLNVSGEVPSLNDPDGDEELLQARDLIGAFVKTIKSFRFYPADNPALKGFQEQLHRKFQNFLSRFESFIFQVGEYDFSSGGRILYENRDVKTSLAFLLYKDGLRELRFMNGLEVWEIQALVEVIGRGDNLNMMEDDLVTLLWEKDFVHIGYLSTDEFLEDAPLVVPENIEQFRRSLVVSPPGHEVEIDSIEAEDQDVDLAGALETFEDRLVTPDRGVYFLTPEEEEGLRKEVEAEADPAFVFNIVDILFEILALEKEREPFQDVFNIMNKVLDALLTLGDFQKAGDLLKRVYLILKMYELEEWQTQIIRQLIVDAGEPARVDRIGRALDREEGGVSLEHLNSYLLLLQRNSIVPLIVLLGDLKNSKARRVICDALSEIGKNAIEQIASLIDDRRWFLVRNITYILGRIGKEQTLPYLQKAFYHQDARVRREAIQGLGLLGTPKALGLLVKAISDEDERIRSMAAINLGKAGRNTGLAPLLEVVQSKEFQRREGEEIKTFFDAIGMIGSSEAVPVLQQILERRTLFGRAKADEMRVGAAAALAMIQTPQAKAVLTAGKESKDVSIRTACLQAIRTHPA